MTSLIWMPSSIQGILPILRISYQTRGIGSFTGTSVISPWSNVSSESIELKE